MATFDQPTMLPTRKVTAAGFGALVAQVLFGSLRAFGIDAPDELEGALSVGLTFAFGWLVRESR